MQNSKTHSNEGKNMQIVGFLGVKGAGKSTTATIVKDFFSAEEVAFADHLKNTCAKVFSLQRHVFDDPSRKEKELEQVVFLTKELLTDIYLEFGLKDVDFATMRPHVGKLLFTPRQIAQYIGTDVLRVFDQDIHCKTVFHDKRAPTSDFLLITDVRFPNEVAFIKANGGRVIYVQSRVAEAQVTSNSHESERHIKTLAQQADYQLENNEDIPELRKNTILLFQQFLLR